MWKRLLLAATLLVAFGFAWRSLDRIAIDVVGQPALTGPIQYRLEQPFFEQLARITGLGLQIHYRTIDTLGIRDDHQLELIRSGALQLVSLRFLQNASTEPTLLGIDLPGLVTDFGAARVVVDAYGPVLDRALQENFGAKLLGIWPFGPQTFFCRSALTDLKDIAGRKIRVGNANFSPLIARFGGTAVVIPFDDVREALRTGLIDCAITSATSANFAGWTDYTSYYFPLGMQMGLNGYVVSLRLWNSLSSAQQLALTNAFRNHVEAIWSFAATADDDATACITGRSCRLGKPAHLTLVKPSPGDYQALNDAAYETTFRDWALRCDAIHPGCSAEWLRLVRPLLEKIRGNPPAAGGSASP